jgi:hypothetical protein
MLRRREQEFVSSSLHRCEIAGCDIALSLAFPVYAREIAKRAT